MDIVDRLKKEEKGWLTQASSDHDLYTAEVLHSASEEIKGLRQRIDELEEWVRTHSRCPKCHGFLNGYSECLSGCGYKDHWRKIEGDENE